MYTPIEHPALWVALATTSVAAYTDFRTGLIPNVVVGSGAVAGVLAQLSAAALGQEGISTALQQMGLGLAVGAIIPVTLYAFGALGGGDLKLFAALGLCLGPTHVLAVELWSHVIALLFVLGSSTLRTSIGTSVRLVHNLFVPASARKPLPRTSMTALRLAPSILLALVWVCVLGERLP